MASNSPKVQIVGLEGLSVTDKAREVVERAGFEAVVRTVSTSDLAYVSSFGATRLPAAIVDERTFQGMTEIRAHFGPKK